MPDNQGAAFLLRRAALRRFVRPAFPHPPRFGESVVKHLLSLSIAVGCTVIGVVPSFAAQQRPLDAEVVRTFENLQWPDWITGADSGLSRDPRPVVISGAGDGSNRMFFATQYGAIFAAQNDPETRDLQLFLDIRERVMPFKPNENEEGFLGLAFHPRFKENGEFFVYYTATPTAEHPHQSVISRFRVSADSRIGTTTAGRWCSVRMGIFTSDWATAAKAAIRTATARISARCSARFSASTSISRIRGWRTRFQKTIRLSIGRTPAAKSGRTAFATCGA
jgi:hypothetical protein